MYKLPFIPTQPHQASKSYFNYTFASTVASKFAQSLTVVVLIIASMFGMSIGKKDWFSGYHNTFGWPTFGPQKPNTRHLGFKDSDWALMNSPFYLNDTLVFKYEAPNATTFPHSVYVLRNFWSFLKCDLKRAKVVANSTQVGGEGFQIVLKRWRPYYFACGEGNGFHCNNGGMKFAVFPMLRRSFFP